MKDESGAPLIDNELMLIKESDALIKKYFPEKK